MFGIIVGTHGIFAEEILKSCEMICGEQKNVQSVTLVPGEGSLIVRMECSFSTISSVVVPITPHVVL